MDILTTLNTAHSAIKIARETFSTLLDSKIEEKAKEKINAAMTNIGNLQDSLFEIRNELFQLQTERDNLKKELDEVNNWDSKMSEYKLIKTQGGGMVYAYQDEPHHYICPRCVAKHEIHPLQDQRNPYTGAYQCPACDKYFDINVAVDLPESGPPSYY